MKLFSLLDSLLTDPTEEQTQRTAFGAGRRTHSDDEDVMMNGIFGGKNEEGPDQEDFEEEQTLVAKLVHLLYNDDLETQFKVYLLMENGFIRNFMPIFSCLTKLEKSLDWVERYDSDTLFLPPLLPHSNLHYDLLQKTRKW